MPFNEDDRAGSKQMACARALADVGDTWHYYRALYMERHSQDDGNLAFGLIKNLLRFLLLLDALYSGFRNPTDWKSPLRQGRKFSCPGVYMCERSPFSSAPHPQEVLLTGPAGSVAVMSSHLWHGGTRNRTQETRRALHPFYMAREQPQSPGHLRAQDYIRVKTYKRLSPAARYLLNVNWDDI